MFICCFFVVCSATCAAATDQSSLDPAPELVTDRPDQTESTAVVPPGMVQIESGITYREDSDDARAAEFGSSLLRTGLHKKLELRLGLDGWQHLSEEEESGWGDVSLGFKLALWPEEGLRPEAALLAWTSLPSGESNFSSDRFDPGFRFSFSHTLSPRLSLGYNLGMAWATEEESTERFVPGLYRLAMEQAVGTAVNVALASPLYSPVRDSVAEAIAAPLRPGLSTDRDTLASFEYTISLGIGLTERAGMFVEAFSAVPLNASGGPAHAFDGGFTYLLRPNLQWDIAGGVGLSDDADNFFVGTGLSVRFPR